MITAEEKTRERFSDKQNHRNIRHQERKRGQDNTIVVADKSRKFSKPRRFDDIENMHCIWHPKGNHTIRNCYTFNDRYTRKDNKVNTKEDNQKKDEDNYEDKGFQKSRGQ